MDGPWATERDVERVGAAPSLKSFVITWAWNTEYATLPPHPCRLPGAPSCGSLREGASKQLHSELTAETPSVFFFFFFLFVFKTI